MTIKVSFVLTHQHLILFKLLKGWNYFEWVLKSWVPLKWIVYMCNTYLWMYDCNVCPRLQGRFILDLISCNKKVFVRWNFSLPICNAALSSSQCHQTTVTTLSAYSPLPMSSPQFHQTTVPTLSPYSPLLMNGFTIVPPNHRTNIIALFPTADVNAVNGSSRILRDVGN